MTTQALRLVGVLLSDPGDEWYGLQLADEAGLNSGTVYLVLARLEQAEWLDSRWEDIDPVVEGRPRRRLYQLTAGGRSAAEQAMDEHVAALGPRAASARSTPRTTGGQVAPA